jgi:CHAT domain-containing protein
VYQQQQQQQQQQEEQQKDAENPFLDPPFSRIKMKMGKNIHIVLQVSVYNVPLAVF